MPTVSELKAEAKERGLRGYSKMKKAELEKLLAGADKAKPASKAKTSQKKINVDLPEFKSPITPTTNSRSWGFTRSDIEDDGNFTPKAKLISQLEDKLKRTKSLGEGGAGEAGAIEKQLDWVKKNYNPPPPKPKSPKKLPPKEDFKIPKDFMALYNKRSTTNYSTALEDLLMGQLDGRKKGELPRAKRRANKLYKKFLETKEAKSARNLNNFTDKLTSYILIES